ncbi:hypothetical protein [Demequina litorisediminis]|uniref:Protein kinase domain-containing protein n=1 Tax=Demequina litorisediminis TaxID=1849022 RepID=A0ABQ6ICG2_9MICO|nr:hypothetical protein [Demequina litorisediminis]GMA35121.1 hypothetical protein GCM10025876_13250 [Demequina litorisediminis]
MTLTGATIATASDIFAHRSVKSNWPACSVAGMAAAGREPGDEIGGYRVVEQAGRGGSGAVYKVVDGGGAEAALARGRAR